MIRIGLLFLLTLNGAVLAQADLKLEFSDLRSNRGDVKLSIFNQSEGFPEAEEKAFTIEVLSIEEAKNGYWLRDIPPGEYAFSVLHDENLNDKMDYNIIHYPKEGFGLSNYTKLRLVYPTWNACKFEVKPGLNVVQVQIFYL